jgi:tRNA threonylcarbamoyladenosine biosynthesis protein TsaE
MKNKEKREIINEAVTKSEKETEEFAKKFAKNLKSGDFVALYGELGSGKTAFVRGLADVFCKGIRVSSPTYAVINEYKGNPDIYHFDMYRITSEESLYSTGFYDYFDRDGIIAVEWSENIPFALTENRFEVAFEKLSDTERKIIITKITP